MLIRKIVEIAYNRQRAKEIQKRVQKKRDNGDCRSFGEILQEEIKKVKEMRWFYGIKLLCFVSCNFFK